MDVVAVAPLPYRSAGRGEFEFGASTMSEDLLAGLARLGHSVRAIAQAPLPLNGGECRGLEPEEPGFSVVPFALDYAPVRTPPDAAHLVAQRARLMKALGRLVAERQPDLVWLSGEALSWFALDVCRSFGIPTLVAVHGAPLAGLEHGLYPPAETSELIARLATAEGHVCVADHLRAMLERMGIHGAVTVRNVIDAARFVPRDRDLGLLRDLSIEPGRPVIGSFSSMRSEKRVGDLIDAAPPVLAARPDAVFLLAGGGVLSGELEREVESRGLAASFRFPGEIDNHEMPRWLSLADLVVLPSEREGYPLAILEAQSCGRPVLASDIPATLELVEEGRPVCAFPMGDSGALAELALELLADPERRLEIGRAGRDAALGDSQDAWARAHERAMLDVVERTRRPSAAAASA
jgi:glycosyltransferase involved in cell wall biosynthesis